MGCGTINGVYVRAKRNREVFMRVRATREGLLVPRKLIEALGPGKPVDGGEEEFEAFIEEPGRLVIVGIGDGAVHEDPILALGEDPVDDPKGPTDASVNHDRYLYG